MFSTRVVRGAGVVQRGLWHSRSGRGSTCPATTAGTSRSAASLGSWTSLTAVRGTAAVLTQRHKGTTGAIPSSGTAVVVLHQVREFSGRSRAGGRGRGMGPSDTGRRTNVQTGDVKDGEKKDAYEFLPKDDLGKLSSQTKARVNEAQGAMKEDTVVGAAASTEEKEETGSVTMWQRWKNARAKMKLLWKQYGLVWIGTYTVLYFGGLAGIYIVLDTGLVASDVDTSAAIQVVADQIGAQDNANVKWLQNTIKTNPKANTLLKAVIVNEFLEYPRDIVAIAATPSIARAIGRAPPKVKS